MVEFAIKHENGVNQATVKLVSETIFLKPNSIARISGDIKIIPEKNLQKLKSNFLADAKATSKVTLQGTGEITQVASLANFFTINVFPDEIIAIHPEAFWAIATNNWEYRQAPLRQKINNHEPKVEILVSEPSQIIVKVPGSITGVTLNEEQLILHTPAVAYASTLKHHTMKTSSNMASAFAGKKPHLYQGSGNIYYCSLPHKSLLR